MSTVVTIAIVDDQSLFRESLGNLIRGIAGFSCILQCPGAAELLAALQQPGAIPPDIVLLDLEMPGTNGIELNRILQKQYPGIRVIILSVHANERLIASLIRDGADGYLTKNCDKQELIEALQMTYGQGYYINKMTLQAIQQEGRQKGQPLCNINGIPLDLTKRETEILRWICKEYSNAEIASELYVSVRTVEGHRNSLIQKVGCKNTAGLVLFAIRNHLHVLVL